MNQKLLNFITKVKDGIDLGEMIDLFGDCSQEEKSDLQFLVTTSILTDLIELKNQRSRDLTFAKALRREVDNNTMRIKFLYYLTGANLILSIITLLQGITVIDISAQFIVSIIISSGLSFGSWFLAKTISDRGSED